MLLPCRPLPCLALMLSLAANPLWAQKTQASLSQGSTPAPTPMKVARDEFLRQNHWDAARGRWLAFKVAPRNVDAMTGDQLRYESAQLMRTHRWDEANRLWVKRERGAAVQAVQPQAVQQMAQTTP